MITNGCVGQIHVNHWVSVSYKCCKGTVLQKDLTNATYLLNRFRNHCFVFLLRYIWVLLQHNMGPWRSYRESPDCIREYRIAGGRERSNLQETANYQILSVPI